MVTVLGRDMNDRFAEDTGQQELIESLKQQRLIAGNTELAEEVARVGCLIHVKTGASIIQQGSVDSDIYLILNGTFDVIVSGRVVTSKFPNDYVGEMVAIQPSRQRTATVVAREPAIVLKLSEPQFTELSAKYPKMLLLIAKELSNRVERRNANFRKLMTTE